MAPPYRHGFSIYDTSGAGGYTWQQNAGRAGELHADVIRMNVFWDFARPSISGPYNTAYLDSLKAIVDAGRAQNPLMTLLPIIQRTPADVPGRSASGHYVETDQGYDHYGQFCSYLVNYLGDRCNFVELSNEPNTTLASNGAGTEIPSYHYGGMLAYAVHWMATCSGSKRPLAGSLATNQGGLVYLDGSWNNYLFGFGTRAHYKLIEINGNGASLSYEWRVSFHSYPRLGPGTNDITGPEAANTVFNVVDQVRSNSGGRKVWLTETGASSQKLGLTEQAAFANQIHVKTSNRQPQMEGALFWPLSDADPQASNSSSAFYKLGVLHANLAAKPAGTQVQTNWA